MKNNKGFISISIVYSFFIVFLLLLILILGTYLNNRVTSNTLKEEIKKSNFKKDFEIPLPIGERTLALVETSVNDELIQKNNSDGMSVVPLIG